MEELFLIAHKPDADELISLFYQNLELGTIANDFEYPFLNLLPIELQIPEYYQSLQTQPLVWVRINKTHQANFKSKYADQIVVEENINETFSAFGLKNNTAIDSEPYPTEVQDISSQKICSKFENTDNLKVWDCCSGAGGKSLFIAENFKKSKLYASDIRETILDNLKLRFKTNRLTVPKIALVDLNKKPEKINFGGEIIGRGFFDVIVADVPCSGSGTWARDPENFTYFDANKIDELAIRQLNIVKATLRFLKPGGTLYYVTCSVFSKENHAIIDTLETLGLVKIISTEMIYGYPNEADNLFIAKLCTAKSAN